MTWQILSGTHHPKVNQKCWVFNGIEVIYDRWFRWPKGMGCSFSVKNVTHYMEINPPEPPND